MQTLTEKVFKLNPPGGVFDETDTEYHFIIANAESRGTIEDLCRMAGFEPPIICTPLELGKEG